MKRVFMVIGILFICGYVMGQAKEGSLELQRTVVSQPAAFIYLPYAPDVVKKALENYLAKTTDKEQKKAKEYLLSANTLIAKNNKSNADMIFAIGLKDQDNKNESIVYLKLNSTSNYVDSAQKNIQFDMKDAKDYLDNLAIAIKPNANKLQLALQQKNLSDARDNDNSLVVAGNKLEQKRENIHARINNNENDKKDKGLAKRKAKNDRLIDENHTARLNSNFDIAKQTAALTLLKMKQ